MGYSSTEKDEYWRRTHQIISEIAQKDILIWTNGNNGRIASPETDLEGEAQYQTMHTLDIGDMHKERKREWAKTSQNRERI